MGIEVASARGSVDRATLDRYLNDDRQPVRRDQARRVIKIRAEVVRTCPRKTGLLVSTNRQSEGREGEKPYTDITLGREGATDYLGYLLYGTRDHDVYPIPNRPNATLRFVWNGVVVFAKHTHPRGIPANNFMVKSITAGRG